MTWAPNGMPSTKDIQNNVAGTVRISFNDGTYLDVKANINVVADSNTDKPDDQKTSFSQRISYQFKGQEVASHTIADIAKGSSLTTDQLKSAIDGNLSNNYSIADGYTYPAAENNINSQPAEIVVPLKQSQKQHDDSDYNAQVIVKYVDSTNGAPLKTKNGKDELTFDFNKKEGLKASTLKANIDNNIPAGWKIAEGFTYPGDQTDNNTITVKLVKNTVTPGEPGVTPDNPEYKDLFTTSTRTINVYKTDNSAIDHTEKQTITFGRTGVLDQYTGKIMEGSEGTWYVYNTTTNKLTSDKTGTWAEYTDIATAPQDYDYMIDGVKTTEAKVATESSVDPNTNKTIDVKYVAQDSTPVPYDPSNKNMNMDVTRTIKYDVSGTGHAAITDQTQTVHYVRKDANGNAGYYNPVTGKTTWVAWTPEAGSAEFSAKNVEQISGFDSYVNGEKGTQAPAAAITTKEIDGYATPQNGKTITVTYKAVSPTEESFTQAIKYVDEAGQELATTADAFTGTFTSDNPATVSAEEIKNQIDNDLKNNSALKGWVVAGNYPVAETIAEKNPAALTVTLKHGTKSVTPTTPGVDPTDPKYKYKDMFTSVSRKIYQTKPGKAEQLIATQTVNFGRNGVEDLVTGKVTGTGAWEVGKIENNKFVLGGEAEYTTAAVEQISSYDSYVNGTKATEIQSASAIENGTPVNGEAVHITYQKSSTVTPTPYDPNNKDMNKDVVRTITVNKVDGTTETIVQTVHFVRGGEGENVEADTPWTVGVKDGNTWKSTGATEGTWPEYNVPQVTDYTSTVDGKDAKVVLADKNVNANTPNTNVVVAYTKTTTPTDADKYTPEGQDVHTTPGVVPPAEKGIKNKDDMPSGTKYTWEKTPDVTNPGTSTGTIIVTYPDGSKDKVNVTVIIGMNHVTPEPQPIHTTPGVVPNPSEGIKNKNDMPEGTKYTWKEVPDVSTIGEHTGVVTVTYPDGSSVDVTVKVYVDATGTSDNNGGKTTETNSEANTAKAATVNGNHHAEKNTLPQTSAKSENTAGILGLAIAAVGSLFGLGVDRKKRQK